ncbi:diacylglycerol kinase family lipid kinase [candidate division WOR-3 bacterium]|nr:diacylglycerol kinase family lipid kinase [candidate division WOR-3 bacterium]
MTLPIIVNPVADRGRSRAMFEDLTDLLDKRGKRYSFYFTEYPGHATLLTEEITSGNDVESLLVLGGDGTYNEVANGCIGRDVKLGLIPGGSCNDFTRELGAWHGLDSFLDSLEADTTELVDAGKVNNRIFLTNVGAGFDAQIIHDMKEKNLKSNLGYVGMVFKNLFTFRGFRARITTLERNIDSNLLMFTVNNASTYGGGFKIAPKADIQDGMLDVCLMSLINKAKFIIKFPKVYSGTHLDVEEVTYWKTEKITVNFERVLPIQVDGELLPLKANELDIQIVPRAFQIYRYESTVIS